MMTDGRSRSTSNTPRSRSPHMPQSRHDRGRLLVRAGQDRAPARRTCTPATTHLTPSIVVGTPTLTCAQGSSASDFGTLLLPHSQGRTARRRTSPTTSRSGSSTRWASSRPQPRPGPAPRPAWAPRCGRQTAPTAWTPRPASTSDAANDGFLNGVAGKPGKLTNVAAGHRLRSERHAGEEALRRLHHQQRQSHLLLQPTPRPTWATSTATTYSPPGPVLSSAIYDSATVRPGPGVRCPASQRWLERV